VSPPACPPLFLDNVLLRSITLPPLFINVLGTLLAVGSLKGYVTLWSLKNGSMVREIKEQGDTFQLSWSADGKMLSSSFSKGLLHIMLADDISV
jgi:WD40 repeat protein